MNTIENTLFIGKVLLCYPRLESTNLMAMNYISKNTPTNGTVILTYDQYGGRGQIGSKWESAPDKNVSLSIILYPDFLESRQQFLLSQTISLGIYDFLNHYITGNLRIKWPNDLYVANEKIAGILIQNVLSGTKIQSAVIGIGININQMKFVSDAPNPVSLAQLTGNTHQLDQLVTELCLALDRRYQQLSAGRYKTIQKEYLSHLYRYGQPARFRKTDNSVFTGTISGISPTGKLVITSDGKQITFGMKEVGFVD